MSDPIYIDSITLAGIKVERHFHVGAGQNIFSPEAGEALKRLHTMHESGELPEEKWVEFKAWWMGHNLVTAIVLMLIAPDQPDTPLTNAWREKAKVAILLDGHDRVVHRLAEALYAVLEERARILGVSTVDDLPDEEMIPAILRCEP